VDPRSIVLVWETAMPNKRAGAQGATSSQVSSAPDANLSPTTAGIPNTKCRRVKGLRREEVAKAAGISVAWFTWIKQAQDLKVSEATV
jgi:hypothetical protein